MSRHILGDSSSPAIEFDHNPPETICRRIFGLSTHGGAATRSGGPAIVSLPGLRVEGTCWRSSDFRCDDNTLTIDYVAEPGLKLEIVWHVCPVTGILTRRDRLVNLSQAPLVIRRVLARFAFQPGSYHVYSQSGLWATENQGSWHELKGAALVLSGEEGRTSQGSTPYLCLWESVQKAGFALHLVPCGNWVIKVTPRHLGNGQPVCVVEAGPADEDLNMTLCPGESFHLPQLLLVPLRRKQPEEAAPALHRYVLRSMLGGFKQEFPVVWNTWLDQFDNLEIDRLRAQLAAAREVGCDILVVDAGWFGAEAGQGAWYRLAGDWRECTTRAFRGRMREFAEEVRAAGLQFGLWMEPEHVGPDAPIRQQHPEWFKGGSDNPRLDIENPQAYNYLRSEILRLIDAYQLAWLKVDFNTRLGFDESGKELAGYYECWYRLLDEIRNIYPSLIVEGCASGGMRCDLASIVHHDFHFLSDTTHPVDVIRISEGALLRLPPGRLGKWMVLRSVGKTIPDYPGRVADAPESLATPPSSGWQPRQMAETFDLTFAALAAMPGVFGLSGDLAGMSPSTRAVIANHVAFYKHWRRFIAGAHGRLLTDVRSIGDRSGWSVLQLSHDDDPRHLLFAYRLMDANSRRRIRLEGLESSALYEITVFPPPVGAPVTPNKRMTGSQLMEAGLEIALELPASASVSIVSPVR